MKTTPPALLALGRTPPPASIEVEGERLELETVFKHDFFAYTGLYRAGERRVVLKVGRVASFFGLPLSWIGRLHAWHESRVYAQVDDLAIVPRFTGRHGKHGLTHVFVEGHPLRRGEQVPDDFFDRLEEGLRAIHARDIAYVDLEKPENVLVGDDGRPHLFDFQIACRWPGRGRGVWPFTWLLERLQASDIYHARKLRRHCRPDTMTREEYFESRRRPAHVRYYTAATRPVTKLRRLVLNRLDPRKKRGERERLEVPPERHAHLVGPAATSRERNDPEA